jgi:GGDEF domain-containing protein
MRVAIQPLAGIDDQLSVMVFWPRSLRDVVASLGHEIGDEVLRRTAQRLAVCCPTRRSSGVSRRTSSS